MQPYYFLFALAFLFTLFATIQDLKKREVANWLNFSLIAFALAFRALYSIQTKNSQFFLLGLAGFIIFTILAHTLYYAKAFAGGDAKLLMGFGIILPYQSYSDIIPLTILFTLSLFAVGAVYSILYSILVALKNKTKFKKEFRKIFSRYKIYIAVSTIIAVLMPIINFSLLSVLITVVFLIPLLFAYT